MDTNNLKNIDNGENAASKGQESSFDIKMLLMMFVLNWKWFLLSVVVFLCGAVFYLRYKSPVYQMSAKVLIKDQTNSQSRGSGQLLSNMQDLGFISNSTGIDNEVEILQTVVLARETVKDLKLYTEYKIEGRIKDQLIYKRQPVTVDLDSAGVARMDDANLIRRATKVEMRIAQSGDKYDVEGIVYTNDTDDPEKPFTASFDTLPAKVETYAGTLTFTPNLYSLPTAEEHPAILVTIRPITAVANNYISSLSVSPTSKTTTIAQITVNDLDAERADNFLRQLVICYNRQANADKNEIAMKTEEFINERLEKINNELGLTEGDLESYKRKHNLTQLRLDATETLTQASQYAEKQAEAQSQIELLNYLSEYIDNPANKYQIIPSNIGLDDAASQALINKFNQTVLERNTLLHAASEIAPQVVTLTSTLDELQVSLRIALKQAKTSSQIKLQSIESQYAVYKSRIASTPEQERVLTEIGRQQEVMSGLYLMLLEKREENSISLAATADNGKLIDDPVYMGKVSPKSSIIMLAALVIGLGLPLLVLYVMQLMRYKIEGHDDIAKLTNIPIIADVALASETAKGHAGIVVHENRNDQIDEIYRSMRTNIQFMLKEGQKVILFTSYTSGEGKTFNAANLSMSFALLGKRVLLMGLDVRKPALGHLFGISDSTAGITPLLPKDKVSLDEIKRQIRPSGVNENLDLMFAGPIPPNPTELLASKTLCQIIEDLKKVYDYIIMDTAPFGLVSDTLQIDKLADVTAVVCRADYTAKSSFKYLNDLADEKKLTNLCIVLNGIDMSKKKYGYYYGYGKYSRYGQYTGYKSYSSYGSYANSRYGNKEDDSIKK